MEIQVPNEGGDLINLSDAVNKLSLKNQALYEELVRESQENLTPQINPLNSEETMVRPHAEHEFAYHQALSQERIDNLPNDLGEIAKLFLEQGEYPSEALREAEAQGNINELPDDLREMARRIGEEEQSPSDVYSRIVKQEIPALEQIDGFVGEAENTAKTLLEIGLFPSEIAKISLGDSELAGIVEGYRDAIGRVAVDTKLKLLELRMQ